MDMYTVCSLDDDLNGKIGMIFCQSARGGFVYPRDVGGETRSARWRSARCSRA